MFCVFCGVLQPARLAVRTAEITILKTFFFINACFLRNFLYTGQKCKGNTAKIDARNLCIAAFSAVPGTLSAVKHAEGTFCSDPESCKKDLGKQLPAGSR